MRVVLVGAGEVAVQTARLLIENEHVVVLVDPDQQVLEELSDDLDCGFLHGDGSRPDVLRQVDPERTDVLICLTGSDQINVIASLVGRSLGFGRVVTSIADPQFEAICRELGLENTIIPSRTISRCLADMVHGAGVLEMSTFLKGDARFFAFTASEDEAGEVARLGLPDEARVVCFYRSGRFSLADDSSRLAEGDEVVILTHSRHLEDLHARWRPREGGDPDA